MKRRTLLRVAGAALGTGTIAGCLSDGDGTVGGPGGGSETSPGGTDRPGPDDAATEPDDATTEPDDTETPPGTDYGDGVVFDTDDEDPFASETIGSRDGVENPDDNRPHGVHVWNAAESERSLTVAVRRGSATPFERTLAFPADGYLSLSLAEPGEYEVAIRSDGESLDAVSVAEARFDCNASSTNVGVMPDGEVRSRTVSTAVACDAPGVTEPTVESEEGTCADGPDGGSASVSFDEERLTIDGRITAPNPCHRATIAALSDDGDSLAVTIGVEDASEDGTVCVECVGSVGYSATVPDDFASPETVTVVHRGAESERTVATAER